MDLEKLLSRKPLSIKGFLKKLTLGNYFKTGYRGWILNYSAFLIDRRLPKQNNC